MKLTSSAFSDNKRLPPRYTCDDENISPPLDIHEVQAETKSLALIMDDPDAVSGTWTHWTMWNIDPTSVFIPEDSIIAESIEGITSFGKSGYSGPCPPKGTGEHRYIFKLYALDTMLEIDSDATIEDLEKAMKGHILERTELIGLYARD